MTTHPFWVKLSFDPRDNVDSFYNHIENIDQHQLEVGKIRFKLDIAAVQYKSNDEAWMFVGTNGILCNKYYSLFDQF